MNKPGYQPGGESTWWWKVAQHLDATQAATINAIAHNVDDPTIPLALQETIRQAQVILLDIFRSKGLLPPDGDRAPVAAQSGGPPAPAPQVSQATAPTQASGGWWVPPFPSGGPAGPPQGAAFAPPPPPPAPWIPEDVTRPEDPESVEPVGTTEEDAGASIVEAVDPAAASSRSSTAPEAGT